MPWPREKPSTTLQRIQTDMDVNSAARPSRLRWSVENVVAKMITMVVAGLESFIAWIALQMHPLTADEDILEFRHAALRGISRKQPSTAMGTVTFTGTNGITIPSGKLLRRADGVEYELLADAVISGGTAVGNVSAVVAGAAGNAVAGIALALPEPVAGIQSAVTVVEISAGADVEGVEELRGRVVEDWQKPPQGGAEHDYATWAKEVPGVTRAWPYPLQMGLGTVVVIFLMDNKTDTIIPTEGEINLVKAHLSIKRPTTADVYVVAPTPVAVDFEINIRPNSIAIQNAIRAELADLFQRESEPGKTLYLSRIAEAVSRATGEFDHVLVSPSANITRSFGQLSVIGTITFGDIA